MLLQNESSTKTASIANFSNLCQSLTQVNWFGSSTTASKKVTSETRVGKGLKFAGFHNQSPSANSGKTKVSELGSNDNYCAIGGWDLRNSDSLKECWMVLAQHAICRQYIGYNVSELQRTELVTAIYFFSLCRVTLVERGSPNSLCLLESGKV